MRDIHLWADRENGVLVQGIDSPQAVSRIDLVQEDAIRFVVHGVRRYQTRPSPAAYYEEPITESAIRLAIGTIDRAPASGTFRLRVADQTTAALTWPASFANAAAVTEFKASILAALQGLSNVGADGIRIDDPAGTPANFFYFTWSDADRDDEIEVVENRLLPWVDASVTPGATPSGYTQLVKFVRFPVALTGAFSRPLPPAVTVIETRAGAEGTNAEQTLVFPAGCMGAVALARDGIATRTMGVDGITATQIASALNEIVPGADTDPAFRVTERTALAGRRFAVEFIGGLAAAAQPLLGIAMLDQIALPHWTGTLDLSDTPLPVEQALNGASNVTLTLELVLGADETYLVPCRVVNDMTRPGTLDAVEQAGAIAIRERVVYIADSEEPYVEAAPGLVFVPTEAGQEFVLSHDLNTMQPAVRVSRRVTADPETWEQVHDDEFDAVALTESTVKIYLPCELVEDEGSPAFVGNYKFFVTSPTAKVVIYAHQHDYDGVRDTLPGGQTLRAKLAALDAAIAALSGEGLVPAARISGKLSPSQIDLDALSAALGTNGECLATLRGLIGDARIIDAIAGALGGNTTFIETLKTAVANPDVSGAIVDAIKDDADFLSLMRSAILSALQTGGALPDGAILIEIPDLVETYPAPRLAPGDGEITPVEFFSPIPRAVFGVADGGTLTGTLAKPGGTASAHYYTVSGQSRSQSIPGARGEIFSSGQKITHDGRVWYAARIDGTSAYPLALERELWTIHVSEEMLAQSTRFAAAFTAALRLAGNTRGQAVVRVLSGTAPQQAGTGVGLNLADIAWDSEPMIEQRVILSPGTVHHGFAFEIERDAEGEISATKTLYTKTSEATPPTGGASFVLRAELVMVDVENTVGDPRGAITLSMRGARASIVPID